MLNSLLCAAEDKMSFVDKLSEAGVVVLIGVVTVFIILAFLIYIVLALKYFDKVMDKWDAKMLIYRANKAKLKAIKTKYIDERDELTSEVYLLLENKEIDETEAKNRIAKIKADYTALKPEIKAKVAELKQQLKANDNIAVINSTEETVTDVSADERIIAVITAAIAVATEQECAIRKVKFKVRSIKELK